MTTYYLINPLMGVVAGVEQAETMSEAAQNFLNRCDSTYPPSRALEFVLSAEEFLTQYPLWRVEFNKALSV